MDIKVLITTFSMIFLAELGDKTQLATFCFAADCDSKLSVFLGSAGALILTSLIAVLLGSVVSKYIPPHFIKMGAGATFMLLGLLMIVFSTGK